MANDVTVTLKGRDETGPMWAGVSTKAKGASKTIGEEGKKAGSLFAAGLGLAAGSGIVHFLSDSIAEAREAAKVTASTAQGIKSMGAESWTSAGAISDLSTAISNKIGVDDEAIQSSANLLLTFGRVKNAAGEGNDVFNRATAAAQDLAAKGFGDADSAAKMLGKALNDPVKGMTALQRAGVQLTDAQKKQVKAFMDAGNILGAQKIILGEVEKQVGGTAEATASAADKLGVKWKNFEEKFGTAMLPIVDDLLNKLGGLIDWVDQHPEVVEWGLKAAGGLLALKGAVMAFNVGKGIFDGLKGLGGLLRGVGDEAETASGKVGKVGSGLGLLKGAVIATGLGVAAEALDRINVQAAGGADNLQGMDRSMHNFLEGGKELATNPGKALGDIINQLQGVHDQFVTGKSTLGQWWNAWKDPGGTLSGILDSIGQIGADVGLLPQGFRHLGDAVKEFTAGLKLDIPVTMDPTQVHSALDQVVTLVDSTTGTITVDGTTLPASAALDQVINAVNSGAGQISINGNTYPAQDALGIVMGIIDSAGGTVEINGNKVPAEQVLAALILKADSSKGTPRLTAIAEVAAAMAALDNAARPRTVPFFIQTVGSALVSQAMGGFHGPARAAGGPSGGWTLVGEQGPELVSLPLGSMVKPSSATQAALGTGTGGMGVGVGGDQTQSVMMTIAPGSDDAVATMIMQLYRAGKIQFRRN